MKKICVNDEIKFQEESLPYTIKAINNRYAICTRNFDKVVDDDILSHKVEMCAYNNKKEAYNDLKNEVIYTIIDFEENVRSTNDFIFNIYDYKDQDDIDTCLDDLMIGECILSGKNEIELTHFDIIRKKC